MADVTLIHPWYPEGSTLALIPLGLAHLCSALSESFSVECQDLNFQKLDLKDSKFLGVSVWTSAFDAAHKVLLEGKKHELFCIAGGPHAVLDPQSLLDVGFDAVVVGDGEFVLPELLKKVECGKAYDKITYGYIKDLDSIPLADFSWTRKYPYKDTIPIMTSRGCPFNCLFCGNAMGKLFRTRSPENIVSELQQYQNRNISFNDDVMTINRKRIIRLSELIREEHLCFLGMGIVNGTRVDCVDEDTIKALVKMGLTNIMYGLESADLNVLKTIRKGVTPQEVDDAIKITRKYGIKPGIFMMIGLPDATLERDLYSMEWIKKRDVFSNWSMTFPLPNTDLYDWINHHGEWLVDPKNYASWLSGVLFHTQKYTITERLQAIFHAHTYIQERGWKSPCDRIYGNARNQRDALYRTCVSTAMKKMRRLLW